MAQTIITSPFTENRMVISVTHTSHGFDSGELGKPMRSSGVNGRFIVARANSAVNAEVVGVLTSVEDANNYTITSTGIVDVAEAIPDAATAGQVLFVAEADDTVLTATEPTAVGAVSKPVAVIIEQNAKMLLIHYRGEVITTGTDTKAPNDAEYALGVSNGSLSNGRVVSNGTNTTVDISTANQLKINVASNSIDEATLKVSNSPTNGQFLSAQSGNTGGLTWAAVAASAISREGGTTSEATTTSTSAMDLITMSSLTIAAASPWTMTSLWRKTTGHASAASGGLKIVADSTVVTGESTTAATLWQSGTSNLAEDGGTDTTVGAKVTNYLASNAQNNIVSRNSSSGGCTYGNVGTLTKDAVFPVGQTTSIVLRANSGNASVTTGSDEIHIYVLSVS